MVNVAGADADQGSSTKASHPRDTIRCNNNLTFYTLDSDLIIIRFTHAIEDLTII